MADYVSQYSGEEIDARLTKVGVIEEEVSTIDGRVDTVEETLLGKVDKVPGKGLSTNDYTTTEKNKLGALPTNADLQTALSSKQDVISDLSTIRSGATAGATAYQKPVGGIPSTDLDSDVTETLEEVDNKSDKDTDAVEGNLAEFDANGNPVDSGIPTTKIGEIEKGLSVLRSSTGIAEGIADTISAGTPQEFVFRKSGGDGVNYMKRIKGKTLAWNQLAPDLDAEYDGSLVKNGNEYTYTSSAEGYNMIYNGNWSYLIPGHKYYAALSIKCSSAHYVYLAWDTDEPTWNFGQCSGEYARKSLIQQAVESAGHFEVHFTSMAAGDVIYIKDVQFVDLTLLFGAGNEPTTVAEFEAMFPEPYYPYNPGELINNDAKALETVGFNLWDEEWELGDYSTTDGSKVGGNYVRSKNRIQVIPGQDYAFKGGSSNGLVVFEYDANGNYLRRDISTEGHAGGVITIPSDCYYVTFRTFLVYGTTYNHDICINLSDPAKNGQYEPYKRVVLPLNLSDLEVISPNIWDEEWELGLLTSNGAESPSDSQIRSKNYIPASENADYYFKEPSAVLQRVFCYDANKTAIAEATYTSSGVDYYFKTAAGTKYILFCLLSGYGTTYANDICINESNPGWNGNYYPHGTFKPFPDGMRGAGTAFDYARRNKADRVMREVDMGNLEWSYQGNGRFIARGSSVPGIISSLSRVLVCSKYAFSDQLDSSSVPDKSIANNSWFEAADVLVKDTDYTDADTFTAAMSGVKLIYEQAVPEEFDLVTPLHNAILVDLDGTERAIYPESTTPSAPFACDSNYSISIQRLLAKLNSIE